MAVAKVTLNGTTLMDTTDATADASKILNTYTAYIGDGSKATGTARSGGNDFVVTVSEVNGVWTPDKTFAEIQTAYSAGKNIYVTSDNVDSPASGSYDDEEGALYYYVFWHDYDEDKMLTNYYIFDSNGVTDDGGGEVIPVPTETISITSNGTHDVTNYASANVNIPSSAPTLQAKTNIAPSTSSQTITPDTGYDGLSSVQINAMPSGTAGTPTATKGTVSNHSVSVTPSVTNTTGYITGSTKTGTAVTVSASELVSGSQNITTNNTYDVTNLASVVVNVSGGSSMNAQSAQSTTRATSSTYTKCVSLTCSKAGTYDVYWSTFRSSTSGTSGSQLYVDGSAYGTADTTTWSNHIQNMHLTGVAISANKEVAVYARSRGSNYYSYVGTLTIIQTA